MVVNFKACGISRGACKLTRTPTLSKKKKKVTSSQCPPKAHMRLWRSNAWEYNCHKKDTALYKVTWVYSLLDLSSLEEFPVNFQSFPLTSSLIIYSAIGCIWLVIKCIIGFFHIMLQLDLDKPSPSPPSPSPKITIYARN